MDSWDWMPFLRDRWLTIALTTGVVVVVTMGVTLMMAPAYQSTSTLAFQPVTVDSPLGFPSSVEMGAASAGELLKSPGVLTRAARILGSRTGDIGGTLDVRVVTNTNLIEIVAEADSPSRAARIANAVAQAYVAENAARLQEGSEKSQDMLKRKLADMRAEIASLQKDLAQVRNTPGGAARATALQDQISALQAAYQQMLQGWQNLPSNEMALATSVQIIGAATPDASPVRPRPSLNFLIALVGGLFVGLAVARGMEMLEARKDRNTR